MDYKCFALFHSLILAGFSFCLPGFLIFGFDEQFYNNLNRTMIEEIYFRISSSTFLLIFWGYNCALLLLFIITPENKERYISIMKRFKTYIDDYNKSHINTMYGLLAVILVIIFASKLLGVIYIVVENKHFLRDIPSYQLFCIGYLFISAITICTLSCLGLKWIKENIDSILPEYTPIATNS